MRWGKRGHAARGYHHGNLKEALVRAALELIAEKGPVDATDCARLADISPGIRIRLRASSLPNTPHCDAASFSGISSVSSSLLPRLKISLLIKYRSMIW